MRKVKKVIALVLTMALVAGLFSGCTSTQEGKALYDAMVKSQDIRSSQTDMQFTLRLDATGLSEEDQQSLAQVKAMLNGAKFAMNMKQVANADNTVAKAQANVNMYLGGMAMDMGVWVDMDMSSTTPKLKEIIKLPAILTSMDPSMAGKEYMVMDLSEALKDQNASSQLQGINLGDSLNISKEFKDKATLFMTKYLLQYDPGFKLLSDAGTRDITTPEGTVKAHIYQVKLDDKATKQLVRYTVNNFANNKDAMDFVVEYIKLVDKYAVKTQGANNPTVELEKAMADFEKEKPAALEKFNKFMDQIQDIKIVGDKGIVLEYGVDPNGYLVSQSGSMDFVFDVAKLETLAGEEPKDTGVFNVGFDFSALTYNINKDMTIDMPVVTPENSIDYKDMLKASEQQKQVTPAPAPKPVIKPEVKPTLTMSKSLSKVYNKVAYLPARDAMKLVKGSTYTYTKGAATIKLNGKTLTLVPGKTTIKLNGKDIKLKAVNGKIVNGKFYISVEALQQLGINVVLK